MKTLSVLLTIVLLVLVCRLSTGMKRAGKLPQAPHGMTEASQSLPLHQNYSL